MSSRKIWFITAVLCLVSYLGAEANRSLVARNSLARTMTAAGPKNTLMNINQMSMWISSDGEFPQLAAQGVSTEYPIGTAGLIWADGTLWGARVDDGNEPIIRVGGSAYAVGQKGGKVLYDAAGLVIGSEDFRDRHAWRVRTDWESADLRKEATSYFLKTSDAVTDADIAELYEQYEYDWNNWPAQDGAPYDDVDGNGSYNPTIDIPGYPGASQTIWVVVNDLPIVQDGDTSDVSDISYGSRPIGLEIQLTLWGYSFSANNPLANMLFKRSRIIYTGVAGGPTDAKLDSMYLVQWSDPDLGDAGDDLIGSDTTLSLGYVYNGGATDVTAQSFGLPVAAGGYDFLQGPIVDDGAGGLDTLGMTAFNFFGAGSPASDPDQAQYSGTLQWWNMMEGFLPRPAYPAREPYTDANGDPTMFVFPGDPTNISNPGDVDGVSFPPGDRRMSSTTGPFQMALGDTQDVIVALIGAMATDNLTSLALLKNYDAFAQLAYDNDFKLWAAPPNPAVAAAASDEAVNLYWGHDASKVASVEATARGMVFEGYNVWQFPEESSPMSEAVKIATFDVANGILSIIEYTDGPNIGEALYSLAQTGTDNGIQRSLLIDYDHVRKRPMTNDRFYYFGVSAYSVYDSSADVAGAVAPPFKHLEGGVGTVSIRPQTPPTGTRYAFEAGESMTTVIHTGTSDGAVNITVVDPAKITGDSYEVTFRAFNDTTPTIVWDLVNTTDDILLIDGNPVQTGINMLTGVEVGLTDNPILDGFMIQVTGAPNDLVSVGVTANAAGPVDPPVDAFPYWSFPSYLVADGNYDGQQSETDATWFMNMGPTYAVDGSIDEALFMAGIFIYAGGYGAPGGTGVQWLVPDDYEIRFTGASQSIDYWNDEAIIDVPFEWWNIGDPADASDDYQLVTYLLDQDGNAEWNLQFGSADADHMASSGTNDPWTDRVYVLTPVDDTPGTVGYDAFMAGAAANPYLTGGDSNLPSWAALPGENDPGGPMDAWCTFSRTVFVSWNGGDAVTATSPADYTSEYPEVGTVFTIKTTKPNVAADTFTFTTSAPIYDDSLAIVDLDLINVFPNPYYGFHSLELSRQSKWMQFTHLPAQATIRIFNLGGIMVWVNEKDDDTQYVRWNLKNLAGFPVASGIYIAHIEMPGFGRKILKLALVQEQQILQKY